MQRQCANANVPYLFVGHVEHSSSTLSAARLRATPQRYKESNSLKLISHPATSDRDDSIIMALINNTLINIRVAIWALKQAAVAFAVVRAQGHTTSTASHASCYASRT